MSTWFPKDDKYRGEIIHMEDEKYGAHHHRHVTHDSDPRNEVGSGTPINQHTHQGDKTAVVDIPD